MRYQELSIQNQRYWFEDLNLGLGIFPGVYAGYEGQWLQWYDATGTVIPSDREKAEQETQRADRESQRAEQESQRADRLAERLRELGIDPNAL